VDEVDLVVVEAVEVSESGAAIPKVAEIGTIKAGTWIVAGMLKAEHESLQMVKECTLPDQCDGGVSLVITELGVIGVSEIGFELLEISPGVCSDDIRMQVRASLHVADDVRRIQLCA